MSMIQNNQSTLPPIRITIRSHYRVGPSDVYCIIPSKKLTQVIHFQYDEEGDYVRKMKEKKFSFKKVGEIDTSQLDRVPKHLIGKCENLKKLVLGVVPGEVPKGLCYLSITPPVGPWEYTKIKGSSNSKIVINVVAFANPKFERKKGNPKDLIFSESIDSGQLIQEYLGNKDIEEVVVKDYECHSLKSLVSMNALLEKHSNLSIENIRFYIRLGTFREKEFTKDLKKAFLPKGPLFHIFFDTSIMTYSVREPSKIKKDLIVFFKKFGQQVISFRLMTAGSMEKLLDHMPDLPQYLSSIRGLHVCFNMRRFNSEVRHLKRLH